MKSRKKVIVIGSGIAGLAAADRLARNFEVFLLEARSRLGGRVWTNRSGSEILDLGAQVIHGFHKNPIAGLAKKLKLKTAAANYEDYYLYDLKGKRLPDTMIRKNQKLFERAVHKLPLQKQSLEAALKTLLKKSFSQQWREWFEESQAIYSGAEPKYHAAQYYQQDNEYEGPNCFFPKGYDQILKAFKNLKHVKIVLNCRVLKVQYETPKRGQTRKAGFGSDPFWVSVVTNRGNFEAEGALITVPLGVLKSKKIKFQPALPDWKQEAIERLGMGTLDMVFMKFSKAFWPTDRVFLGIFGKPGDFMRYVNRCHMQQTPMLVALMAGKKAEQTEKLSDRQIVKRAMQPLRKIFGAGIPNPVEIKITRWATDPFSLGSYSFIATEASPRDYDLLAKPLAGRLFFAGEATNREHPGTVHGAYLSGLREAARIKLAFP